MWQHNSGAVKDFILPYSAVYLRIQKWKNYWNRSTFAKVIHQHITAYFFWPTLYTHRPIYFVTRQHIHIGSIEMDKIKEQTLKDLNYNRHIW